MNVMIFFRINGGAMGRCVRYGTTLGSPCAVILSAAKDLRLFLGCGTTPLVVISECPSVLRLPPALQARELPASRNLSKGIWES